MYLYNLPFFIIDMLESDPICYWIEVINEMNESSELFTNEVQIDKNLGFLNGFSLSSSKSIMTTVKDSNIRIPCAQSNKKSMQLKHFMNYNNILV